METNMGSEKVLPCPFCGQDPISSPIPDVVYCENKKCPLFMLMVDTHRWNDQRVIQKMYKDALALANKLVISQYLASKSRLCYFCEYFVHKPDMVDKAQSMYEALIGECHQDKVREVSGEAEACDSYSTELKE